MDSYFILNELNMKVIPKKFELHFELQNQSKIILV